MGPVRVREAGWAALLLECDTVDEARAWRDELWHRRHLGELPVEEIVPGARSVLLDGVPDPAATAGRLAGWSPRAGAGAGPAELVEIPTGYDGEDLPRVARHWGTSPEEVVALHTGTEFQVDFCGFAPGFAYLSGLARTVPRLDTPRTRVPAGSVALAGPYTGVYPAASPGGWLLIGRTEVRLFDPARQPPALLAPGTRVRFRAVPA
jgi:KipI family sensor histidine kinase inhibitor